MKSILYLNHKYIFSWKGHSFYLKYRILFFFNICLDLTSMQSVQQLLKVESVKKFNFWFNLFTYNKENRVLWRAMITYILRVMEFQKEYCFGFCTITLVWWMYINTDTKEAPNWMWTCLSKLFTLRFSLLATEQLDISRYGLSASCPVNKSNRRAVVFLWSCSLWEFCS